jgi:dTDP-glucose 4,6-dehydratase
MTLNALEGKPLPVYGDGLQVRDWLHVDDHCWALQMVLERAAPGETYNIGANCERTNLEVVRSVCELVDEMRAGGSRTPSRQLIEHVIERPGHDRRYAIDASKIRRELGWRPRHDFDSALRQTVQWYLDNSRWVERVTSGSYQRERMGLAA